MCTLTDTNYRGERKKKSIKRHYHSFFDDFRSSSIRSNSGREDEREREERRTGAPRIVRFPRTAHGPTTGECSPPWSCSNTPHMHHLHTRMLYARSSLLLLLLHLFLSLVQRTGGAARARTKARAGSRLFWGASVRHAIARFFPVWSWRRFRSASSLASQPVRSRFRCRPPPSLFRSASVPLLPVGPFSFNHQR